MTKKIRKQLLEERKLKQRIKIADSGTDLTLKTENNKTSHRNSLYNHEKSLPSTV